MKLIRSVALFFATVLPLRAALGQVKPPAAPARPPATRPAAPVAPRTPAAAVSATRPATTAPTLPAGFKEAPTKDRRVRLAYPRGWESLPADQIPEGPVTLAFLTEDASVAVTVGIVPVDDAARVKENVTRTIEEMKSKFPGFALVEDSTTRLGDLAARRVVFDTRDDSGPTRTMQVFASDGKAMFITTFVSPPDRFAKMRPTAEQILGTIKFNAPAGAAAPAAAAPAAGAANALEVFDGKEHGFALKYPAAWTKVDPMPAPQMVFLVMPVAAGGDDQGARVATMVIPLAGAKVTLKDFAAGLADGARAGNAMKLVANTDATLAGAPARRLTLAGTVGGADVKIQHVCLVRAGRGYDFFCTAGAKEFDRVQTEFQKVLNTVEWKK